MSEAAPKRTWGSGSVELRGPRWIARWRDSDGKQRGKMFDTAELASDYLDEICGTGRGNRPIPVGELRAIAAHWRAAAAAATPPWRGPGPADEDVSARVSTMIRETTAQTLNACAADLERLYGNVPAP